MSVLERTDNGLDTGSEILPGGKSEGIDFNGSCSATEACVAFAHMKKPVSEDHSCFVLGVAATVVRPLVLTWDDNGDDNGDDNVADGTERGNDGCDDTFRKRGCTFFDSAFRHSRSILE